VSRRRRLPQGLFQLDIEDLARDGRGIGHLDDKTVRVEGALPGERVEFRYTRRRRQFDEGVCVAAIRASPDRVSPPCAVYGTCGGCSLQHLALDRQVALKSTWLTSELAAQLGEPLPQSLPPLRSRDLHYRRKARLAVRDVPGKGRVLVGFRERHAPYVTDMHACVVLDRAVVGLDALSELIGGLSIRGAVPQIEVAVGDVGQALIFRVLEPPTPADLDALAAFGRRFDVQIHIQTKGPETIHPVWSKAPALSYRLPRYDLELAFRPEQFTQVNPGINLQMVDLAIELLAPDPTDTVLDLFCGLGNFTLPIARHAATVVGVEGAEDLVDWARRNALRNAVNNVRFHAQDLTTEVDGSPWTNQAYDRVLLDPPRSGALEMIPVLGRMRPKTIVYVSCHPATLARDGAVLVRDFGYRLTKAGVMDMFPHTMHVESIAAFELDCEPGRGS
jgi:23S rRNA (uracil1939-C5)-methyltransferase